VTRFRQPVPSLTGGVSQQPPSIRLSNQAEASTNTFTDVVEGLTKRHPMEHVAKINSDQVEDETFVHAINRDATERYIVLIRPNKVEVVDALTGDVLPVHGPTAPFTADFGYLWEGLLDNNELNDPENFIFSSTDWAAQGGNPLTAVALPSETPPAEVLYTGALDPQRLSVDGIGTIAVYGQPLATPGVSIDAKQCISCFFKLSDDAGNESDTIRLEFIENDGVTTQLWHDFDIDISTGEITVGAPPAAAANTPGTVGVDRYSGGWYRCYIGVESSEHGTLTTGAVTNGDVRIHVRPSASPANKSVIAWGAHWAQGTLTPPPYAHIQADVGEFRATTIADTTIVLNGKRKVHRGLTTQEAWPDDNTDEALVFIKQGGIADAHYEIKIKLEGGSEDVFEYTTSNSATQSTSPDAQADDDIAESLRADMVASGYTVTREGSTLHIKIQGSSPIETLTVTDSGFGALIGKVHREVEVVTDLPAIAPEGYYVKVVGAANESELDDFWVEFNPEEGEDFGNGFWKEVAEPGSQISLDPATMPHKLTRMQDDSVGTVTGTADQIYFEWAPIDWTDRIAGDDLTNPFPSFVSNSFSDQRTINDVFFFQNRLGFLSDQNVILSEASGFFNFFRITTAAFVESDVVDVQAAHTRVSILNSAAPFNQQLILFSDRTQFILSGSPSINARNVSIRAALEFENYANTPAIATGRSVFFAYPRSGFSGVRELFQDSEVTLTADDVAQAIPRFIKGVATRIAASTLADMLVLQSDDDKSELYTYKFFWQNQERRQSAWVRWRIEDDEAEVVGIEWVENELYLVIQRDEGVFLEKMEVSSAIADEGASYTTHLDRRLKDTDTGVSSVYDPVTDQTTITIPYNVATGATMRVYTRNTASTNGGLAKQVASAPAGGASVVVEGDVTGTDLWIGQTFTATHKFSRPFVRQQTARGTLSPVAAVNSHRAIAFTVLYRDTSDFVVKIEPENRPAGEKRFNSALVGGTTIGELSLQSGRLRTGILFPASKVDVSIESSSGLPFKLQSAEWEVSFDGSGSQLGAV